MDPVSSLEISRELSPNENLLWAGIPQQGLLFRSSDLFQVPFSILWCGFALFWEFTVVTTDAPFFFKLWGIPFVLIGIYLVLGRFIYDSKQRENTYYGITNDRVIIISGLFGRNVKSLNIRTLTDVSFTERANNKGSITFGSTSPLYAWFGGGSWLGMRQQLVPSFEMIENPRMVYDLINSAQKAT